MLIDLHKRVDLAHLVRGGIELLAPYIGGTVDHLPLQVGKVDDIEIHKPDASDAGRGEIKPERRAQIRPRRPAEPWPS